MRTDEDSADAIALAVLAITDGEQYQAGGIVEDLGPEAAQNLTGSIAVQLEAVEQVKKIVESRGIDSGRLLAHLRVH